MINPISAIRTALAAISFLDRLDKPSPATLRRRARFWDMMGRRANRRGKLGIANGRFAHANRLRMDADKQAARG